MIRGIVIAFAFVAVACEESTMQPKSSTETSSPSDTNIDNVRAVNTATSKPNTGLRTQLGARRQVQIEDHPYMVALYDKTGEYQCPGTILTPRLILTAYHCMLPDRPYSVRVNSKDLYYGNEKYWIEKYIKHPDSDIYTDDIALVLLKNNIRNAVVVKLMYPRAIVDGALVQGVGWGARTSQKQSRFLSEVNLLVTPPDKCLSLYGKHSLICTETNKSCTCDGDDGGPIMYKGYQIGIVSHSYVPSCCSGVPTANVNLAKYRDWIEKNVKMPKQPQSGVLETLVEKIKKGLFNIM